MEDASSHILVTMDGYHRRGKFLNHKKKADEAMEIASLDVDNVLVWKRHEELHPNAKLDKDRDVIVNDVVKNYKGERVDPVTRDAEDILFILYTSGATAKPKGCQHRTGGYLAYVIATAYHTLDIHPEDTYWCAADIGWITGHSYVVYGPLGLGTTTLMYEGAPDTPHKGRVWEIAEKYGVDIFHTSPTMIRMFMKWGKEYPEKYNFNFRHMATVGEPIQPEVWLWCYKYIGKEKATIVDTWWQTETGGFLCSTLPALGNMKPGSTGNPQPGIYPVILDENGNEIEAGTNRAGNMCIKNPWPGMLQILYGEDKRYIKTYWEEFSDLESKDWRDWIYLSGDGALLARDGYYRVLGRLDDVLSVAGHRLGTMELESAIVKVKGVAESAVVGKKHLEKGMVPVAFAVTKEGVEPTDKLKGEVGKTVGNEISPIARPKGVYFVEDLPKTRSGKIMRRLLSDIVNDRELGDVTSLKDPEVPKRIKMQVKEGIG